MGRLAPEITTVSKPKIKPASAAINEIPKRLFPPVLLEISICSCFNAVI
jgi:hypothetical protein